MIYPLDIEDKPHLLALDLGLRFGWATYTQERSLIAYGSQHCAGRSQLKRLAYQAIQRLPLDSYVFVEGGGSLLKLWQTPTERRLLNFYALHAEEWRIEVLAFKHRQRSTDAKTEAIKQARPLIFSQSGQRSTSLRHDAAEAILMGWWALYRIGWCPVDVFCEKIGQSSRSHSRDHLNPPLLFK